MTTSRDRFPRAMSWLWRHTSAGIALLLIVAALFVGYRIGAPASDGTGHPDGQPTSADATKPAVYTCSMHPSVRLTDPNAKCPICFMDLIPVKDDAGGEGSERRLSLSEDAARASRIETATVGRFFPAGVVRLYGKVTYDETSVARLTAYFPGRIERLFVNYVGVPVRKGDHLAEIYSPELLAAFEELRQSKQSVDGADGGSALIRETSRETLEASREKLRLFGLTPAQIEAVEDGSFDSDRLTIYAPIGGVTTSLSVREGDYVQTGDPIATVADLSRLWLDLEAYESQLPLLRWGQRVTFTVEAHPGETFDGRISFIEPRVDERTRTAAVRVAVDNQDQSLKPGMFASAVVRPRIGEGGAVLSDDLAGRWVCSMHPMVVRDAPGACDICGMDLVSAESLGVVGDPSATAAPLVIPRSAVLFTGTRSVVYVEVDGAQTPTYEAREVVLGPRAGDFYVVRSGLREGEPVVVNGAFRLDSAMQIAAKPSMMTPRDDEPASDRPDEPSVPSGFLERLGPVYAAYFRVQEALADDDLAGFQAGAEALRHAIAAVGELGLVGEDLGAWRRSAADLRADATIASLDEARTRFERMSDGIIALQRRFGHAGGETWHLAYCPMAFDFKGADWLQRGAQIDNPYFGASMLRCGEIREAFGAVDEAAQRQGETR